MFFFNPQFSYGVKIELFPDFIQTSFVSQINDANRKSMDITCPMEKAKSTYTYNENVNIREQNISDTIFRWGKFIFGVRSFRFDVPCNGH